MHLTASGYAGGEVHGMLGYVELDASTLTGFIVAVEFYCASAYEPDCGSEFNSGQTLEAVPCP